MVGVLALAAPAKLQVIPFATAGGLPAGALAAGGLAGGGLAAGGLPVFAGSSCAGCSGDSIVVTGVGAAGALAAEAVPALAGIAVSMPFPMLLGMLALMAALASILFPELQAAVAASTSHPPILCNMGRERTGPPSRQHLIHAIGRAQKRDENQ